MIQFQQKLAQWESGSDSKIQDPRKQWSRLSFSKLKLWGNYLKYLPIVLKNSKFIPCFFFAHLKKEKHTNTLVVKLWMESWIETASLWIVKLNRIESWIAKILSLNFQNTEKTNTFICIGIRYMLYKYENSRIEEMKWQFWMLSM